MHFTTVTAASFLAAAGMVSAQTVHVVTVSNKANAKIFTPDNLKAAPGDMIQFQFLAGNHSVVQSNFDNPCTPIHQHVANATGFFSGYMDVQASAASGTIPTFTIQVADQKPVWVYCSQAKHCQAGMVMVVNENTAANASRSLDAFKKLAASAPANLDPNTAGTGSGTGNAPVGGTTSSAPSPTGTGSGGSGSGSGSPSSTGSPSNTASPSDTGSPSGSTTTPSSSPTSTPPGSAGVALSAPAWTTGLLGFAAAALMLL
ncbi:hypothetical protein F5Y17DRAFT_358296 [Xylariaceae sp. FL0594]|nr:hypothetical protein F5Y17DRAFT_358296 [Xylariaceae sp. FL0594]